MVEKAMPEKTPKHVAIIMDGNRRWAAKKGLGNIAGHNKAAEDTIKPIVEYAIKKGIRYLTFWAFSTENKNRDKEEVQGLINIFRKALKTNLKKLAEMGVQIKVIGDMNWFPKDIAEASMKIVKNTKGNRKIVVSFALNYGGREEILRATSLLLQKIRKRKRSLVKKLTEKEFRQYLYTNDTPDPDLVIRTGGEKRLSGYLPWQSVYSELYFTKTLWPDFTPQKFEKALKDFAKRNRRFGKGKFTDYKK